jgi:hypothetical protein
MAEISLKVNSALLSKCDWESMLNMCSSGHGAVAVNVAPSKNDLSKTTRASRC